jgi:nickel transport protein
MPSLPWRTAFLLILAAPPIHAHDLWIERDKNLHTLVYGHERSAHAGEKTLRYVPEHVRQGACYDARGPALRVELTQTYPVSFKGDCAASWFLVSSGYWTKTPYGTRNLPKNEAGPAIDSWLSTEGVKRIDSWSPGLSGALTQALEFSALENPLSLKTGDKLRLRAWYQGRPVAGVTVAYFGKPRGVTDSDGRVNIRLNQPGFQLIQGSLELPLNDGKADKAIHSTTLHFDLP